MRIINPNSKTARNQLVLKTPSSWWGNLWREALPSGNGTIGAAVYGGVGSETILLNHSQLWHAGKKGQLPDMSHILPEVRKKMDEGKYTEANEMLVKALASEHYESVREVPLPLADLKVSRTVQSRFRHYQRTLNMETGEVSVRWEETEGVYERVLFVSRRDDLIVYELRGRRGAVEADIELKLHDKGDSSPTFKNERLEASMAVSVDNGYFHYAATNEDGTDFGAVLRVIPRGGHLDFTAEKIMVKEADNVLVLIKVFVKGERNREWKRLKEELDGIHFSYDELLARHTEIHGPLFGSAEIALGNVDSGNSNEELLLESYEGELSACLAEKLWAFGRYLFISATRPEGQPCALYGLWGGDYKLVWSHHMANENIQMMYWHAAVGGLSELVVSMFNYYESMMEDFRANARKLFGCRGIFIPAGTTPGVGAPFQVVPVIMNWTGAAGWLSRHYYDYYLFTGDVQFLRERALPFMREAALFYEDFFVVGDDGYFISYPSVSPENTPANFMPEGHHLALDHAMPSAMNATMDFAIAKELLTQLIEGCRTANAFIEEVSKWEEMLARIPPYQINGDGAVKEWMHPDFEDNYHHRHISHIYPVFPGHEVSKEKQPELFEAFMNAVKKRLVIGIGDQTAWSFAHLANIYARMEQGSEALECLELLARACLLNNFYTVHNDWRNMGISIPYRKAPVQLDANMGWVSAVQEMLLYVSPNCVKLLPALPKAWGTGSVKGLRFCTGSISFSWDIDRRQFAAELYAERETEIHLQLPSFSSGYTWQGEDAKAVPSPHGGNSLYVSMKARSTLFIKLDDSSI